MAWVIKESLLIVGIIMFAFHTSFLFQMYNQNKHWSSKLYQHQTNNKFNECYVCKRMYPPRELFSIVHMLTQAHAMS